MRHQVKEIFVKDSFSRHFLISLFLSIYNRKSLWKAFFTFFLAAFYPFFHKKNFGWEKSRKIFLLYQKIYKTATFLSQRFHRYHLGYTKVFLFFDWMFHEFNITRGQSYWKSWAFRVASNGFREFREIFWVC